MLKTSLSKRVKAKEILARKKRGYKAKSPPSNDVLGGDFLIAVCKTLLALFLSLHTSLLEVYV